MAWRTVFPLLVAILAGAARADDTSPPPDSARGVIESQLSAFAQDNAELAYSFAAPGIRSMFPDARQFLEMVAKTYPPVYRHRSVDFGPTVEDGGKIAETVYFTDDDGQVWTALYTLEKEPDGHLGITGCVMQKSEEKGL